MLVGRYRRAGWGGSGGDVGSLGPVLTICRHRSWKEVAGDHNCCEQLARLPDAGHSELQVLDCEELLGLLELLQQPRGLPDRTCHGQLDGYLVQTCESNRREYALAP